MFPCEIAKHTSRWIIILLKNRAQLSSRQNTRMKGITQARAASCCGLALAVAAATTTTSAATGSGSVNDTVAASVIAPMHTYMKQSLPPVPTEQSSDPHTFRQLGDTRYRNHGGSDTNNNKDDDETKKNEIIHLDNLNYYKHQENEITRLGFALAFLLVVLPPVTFICFFAPGECLAAIGMSMIIIGLVLRYVHSQDPAVQLLDDKYSPPAHTNPVIYVLVGIAWIVAGFGKKYIQEMRQEIEHEDAEDRRRKYSERRTMWQQESSRERRRRERQKRREQRAAKGGGGNYEMVPLQQKQKTKKKKGHESDTEDDTNNDDEQSLRSSFSEMGYNSSFSESRFSRSDASAMNGYHSSFSEHV